MRRPRTAAALLAAAALILAGVSPAPGAAAQDGRSRGARPTVVLVHGAWADASSWSGVVARLQADGYPVRAIANPLRSLTGDAASVKTFLATLTGPVVLVGHSYGGAVITNAATGNPAVKALVYVNAFAPDAGESATQLAGPDSALSVPDPATVFDLVPPALPPAADTDLYLKKATVVTSFASGLSLDDKAIVAATQRPATVGALNEPSGAPAWRSIPSWYVIGAKDRIIPPGAQRAMAERAGSTVVEYDAGHVGLMTAPRTVTQVIEQAARASTR
ncbi:pimeloyl-ACP methyl ester carboxylesterase [Nonomuraea thailandensis]|uniref:Pimeloyl-ACP methyl ester carboxylesterase n=1 Tax=Nonomuraea thailandensis TaxID=1188745 RepID=A0A9X2GAN0_9ACTN|nr:alpha/beta fold hydrolase [Nonomuraea thailandensis]MCP2355532.1 pimeloyl-ACP methyl ester carboxylesterase [Nonomuraea thailandensis]